MVWLLRYQHNVSCCQMKKLTLHITGLEKVKIKMELLHEYEMKHYSTAEHFSEGLHLLITFNELDRKIPDVTLAWERFCCFKAEYNWFQNSAPASTSCLLLPLVERCQLLSVICEVIIIQPWDGDSPLESWRGNLAAVCFNSRETMCICKANRAPRLLSWSIHIDTVY